MVGNPAASVVLRFVLPEEPEHSSLLLSLTAEAAAHRDLLFLQRVLDGRLYVTKIIGWMRAALSLWPGVRWVMHADDDAFVRIGLVLDDLRLLHAHGFSNVIYGAMEWQTYAPYSMVAMHVTWGATAGHAAAGWRRHVNRTRRTRLFSRPFPFAKGPLKVWDAEMAAFLAYGERAMEELRYVENHPRDIRLLDDVFMGYVLASDRSGRGRHNVTFVDIVAAHGVKTNTLLPSLIEFRPPHLPLQRPPFGCARGVHFGAKPTTTAAHRWMNTSVPEVKASAFATLSCHRTSSCPPPIIMCNNMQPYVSEVTQGVVTVGEDWTWCRVRIDELVSPCGQTFTALAEN